jgi:hypothetical protein
VQYSAISFTNKDMSEYFSGDAKVGKPELIFNGLAQYCLGVSASGQIQRIASVLALTRADKRALFCEVR